LISDWINFHCHGATLAVDFVEIILFLKLATTGINVEAVEPGFKEEKMVIASTSLTSRPIGLGLAWLEVQLLSKSNIQHQ